MGCILIMRIKGLIGMIAVRLESMTLKNTCRHCTVFTLASIKCRIVVSEGRGGGLVKRLAPQVEVANSCFFFVFTHIHTHARTHYIIILTSHKIIEVGAALLQAVCKNFHITFTFAEPTIISHSLFLCL